MLDKDTKTAILFFAIELGLLAAIYFLLRAGGLAAGMLAIPIGMAAVSTYVINLIFIGRLLSEGRRSKQPNRQALQLAFGSALYPLFAILLYITNA